MRKHWYTVLYTGALVVYTGKTSINRGHKRYSVMTTYMDHLGTIAGLLSLR